MAAEKDPYLVPGLVRGLAALQAFTRATPELTLSQIADALGVTRSAAFRTVHTLVCEGYLLAGTGGAYRLGPAVLRLGYGYHTSRELLQVAQPALEKLRDDLDWSTHLGVLDARHVLYLIRWPATDGLSSLVHVGSRLPAATTAMGRVLLAHRTEREVRRLYADQEPRTAEAVLRRWAGDRGAATIRNEGSFESGLCSVAAPVRDMSGQAVAAISATKVAGAVPATVEAALAAAAMAIGRGLGWTPVG